MNLSIIIPNYNGEKYLKNCLDSIFLLKADFEYEVLLIDDRSNDKSLEIANTFLNKIPLRILKLDKNKGVSNARNIGLKEARGKYIFFLDSDDSLTNDAFNNISYYIKKNYDIVHFNYRIDYSRKLHSKNLIKHDKSFEIINDYNEELFKLFVETYYLNHVWGELIKKEYAVRHEFDITSIMAEDFKYNLNLFFSCKNILLSNKCTVLYRINQFNLTNTTNIEKIIKKTVDSVKCYSDLFIYDYQKKYTRKINKRIRKEFLSNIFILYCNDRDNFEINYNKFKKDLSEKYVKDYMNYNYVKKVVCFRYLCFKCKRLLINRK